MSELSRAGISISLPDGWEGRIYDRAIAPTPDRALAQGALTAPIMHAASFAIPPGVGDFGGGAVELMSNRDLFIVLMDYGRESAGQPLFASRGVPRLAARDVSTSQLQRQLEGQGGVQRFFSESDRAFCLYVVFGSYLRRSRTIPIVNGVLESLTIV